LVWAANTLGRLGRERGARLIPLESFDTDAVAAWLLTAASVARMEGR
jgi:hypothetical protein